MVAHQRIEFGYYSELLQIEAGPIKIAPLPNLAETVAEMESSESIHKGWLYALPQEEIDILSGVVGTLPYPSRVFGLAKTHTIEHSAVEGDEHLSFHLWTLVARGRSEHVECSTPSALRRAWCCFKRRIASSRFMAEPYRKAEGSLHKREVHSKMRVAGRWRGALPAFSRGSPQRIWPAHRAEAIDRGAWRRSRASESHRRWSAGCGLGSAPDRSPATETR